MFVECKRVKDIWKSIEHDISESIKVSIKLSPFDIIFGYLLKNKHILSMQLFLLPRSLFMVHSLKLPLVEASTNISR